MKLWVFYSWPQLLDVLGTWLGAIATFIAAYVALRVANQANRPAIRVYAKPMIEVTRGVRGSKRDLFFISATNVSLRPVTIKVLGIKSYFPRYDAILLEGMLGSSPLPVTLKDGDTANWQFPEITPDGKNWYRGFAEHIKDWSSPAQWLLVQNLRFLVATSLGDSFQAPASKEFRQKVRAQILEVRKPQ